jgi:Protein of unknown function (DUF3037)
VPARVPFDYVIVRVVPRVDRDEFVNAGVILHAPAAGFLGCTMALPATRLRALAPDLDLEIVGRHLDAVAAVCAGDAGAGPIARLNPSERFHWLSAPRSTVIQPSPTHTGICDDPGVALARLYERAVGAVPAVHS